MGIVASSEAEVKDKICELTRVPMSVLANAMGVAWAGGCGSFVGEGMDRTSWGWQARYDGCGGYRAMDRLFLKYADWRIELKEVKLIGNPSYTEMTPLLEKPVILDNFESSRPFKRTAKISYARRSDITDTKTTAFSFGTEFSMSAGIKPPSATGGPEASKTFKISFGTNVSMGHTETTSTQVTEEETIEREMPPYSRVKGQVRISQVQATQAYVGVFKVNFSIGIGGFLKWGGNDRNSPDTNYHKDFAGSGARPWVDQYTWGKFGDNKKPFWQDLREKSSGDKNPWEWKRLFQQHPEARAAVDFLTNESNFQFELGGRLDNIAGTAALIKFYDEEFNPAHARQLKELQAAGKLSEGDLRAGILGSVPEYLSQDLQI